MVSCHTADSKPVNQEVNGTVILPPLVFPVGTFFLSQCQRWWLVSNSRPWDEEMSVLPLCYRPLPGLNSFLVKETPAASLPFLPSFQPVCLPACLSTCLPTCLSACLHACLPGSFTWSNFTVYFKIYQLAFAQLKSFEN
jgi:hypothetical protein